MLDFYSSTSTISQFNESFFTLVFTILSSILITMVMALIVKNITI